MGAKSSKFILCFSLKKNSFIKYIKEKKYNYENRRAKQIYKKVFTEDIDDYDNSFNI